ncbi:DUF1641 domain-containing protein [Nocardioides sp. GY 10127]|uniref:DUF1641 domain-containing protein n=1 Tax=Nocardioides sp. GY 10127 TaxID=2569762 RepID=UPI0010A9241E|nr:DUF1641 domain-containing protein [Nocardioides sp. GY 10127]TIC82614.1 DUF1641 domain-containing protein [Nocardioides sp. GY 10127]
MTVAPPRPEGPAAILASRLDDPQVAASLATLLEHADLVAVLLEGLDGFLARSESIGASLMEAVVDARATVEGNELLGELQVDVPKVAGAAVRLINADLLTPEAVDQVSVLARGLVQGGEDYKAAPIEVGGPLSLLKLLKDPDVNRAISYFATVAKAIGREVAKGPDTPTTRA